MPDATSCANDANFHGDVLFRWTGLLLLARIMRIGTANDAVRLSACTTNTERSDTERKVRERSCLSQTAKHRKATEAAASMHLTIVLHTRAEVSRTCSHDLVTTLHGQARRPCLHLTVDGLTLRSRQLMPIKFAPSCIIVCKAWCNRCYSWLIPPDEAQPGAGRSERLGAILKGRSLLGQC